MDHSTYFFLSFTSLFSVVNPFSATVIFTALTENNTQLEINKIAKNSVIVAFIAMIVFSLLGKSIYFFFNISVEMLRGVGGVLFFIIPV